MKAALLKEYRKFEMVDRDIQDPSNDQVQVQISHASICGTDMHIFNGDFHPRTPVPFIPGHEMAGTVVGKGAGVDSFQIGQKVAIDPIIWCGECASCKLGHYPACVRLKLLGVDMDGGFAQFINVAQSMLYKAPDSLPPEHIALVELYGIGFHACRRAGVKPGDSIVIWGSGRVGQVILQAARTLTDETIYMVDLIDNRLRIAATANADVVPINAMNSDPVEEILEKTNGRGCDIAFEAVGHAQHLDRSIQPIVGAIRSIRGGGKVCVLGLSDEPVPIVFKELIWKEAHIITSRVSHGEYPVVIENLAKGVLRPDSLISGILPAEQIQEAFELIEKDPAKYLKILLEFTSA